MRIYVGIACALALIACITIAWRTSAEHRALQAFRGAVDQNVQFSDMLSLYKDLLAATSAEEAQEALKELLPADSRSHLLAHEAGFFLYAHKGPSGIAGCATYFAGACYHGFLIAMTAEKGTDAASELMSACTKGLAGERQLDCAHGLGHAFLRYVGYEKLPDALALCASALTNDDERGNCYSGAFMENNFGEFNTPPTDRWYRADDPMYPCNEPFTLSHPGAHDACWFMQSQGTLNVYAYPRFEGDIVQAADYCEDMENDTDMTQCFFSIALQIQQKTGNDLPGIQKQCSEMNAARAERCVWDAVGTSYYYGDRDPSATVFHICQSDPDSREECQEVIFELVANSHTNPDERLRACNLFGEDERAACEAHMRAFEE